MINNNFLAFNYNYSLYYIINISNFYNFINKNNTYCIENFTNVNNFSNYIIIKENCLVKTLFHYIDNNSKINTESIQNSILFIVKHTSKYIYYGKLNNRYIFKLSNSILNVLNETTLFNNNTFVISNKNIIKKLHIDSLIYKNLYVISVNNSIILASEIINKKNLKSINLINIVNKIDLSFFDIKYTIINTFEESYNKKSNITLFYIKSNTGIYNEVTINQKINEDEKDIENVLIYNKFSLDNNLGFKTLNLNKLQYLNIIEEFQTLVLIIINKNINNFDLNNIFTIRIFKNYFEKYDINVYYENLSKYININNFKFLLEDIIVNYKLNLLFLYSIFLNKHALINKILEFSEIFSNICLEIIVMFINVTYCFFLELNLKNNYILNILRKFFDKINTHNYIINDYIKNFNMYYIEDK